MNNFNSINKILAEWNPIGVPNEIADVEYTSYVGELMRVINNKEKIFDCLTTMLKSIGFSKKSISDPKVNADINRIANYIKELGTME